MLKIESYPVGVAVLTLLASWLAFAQIIPGPCLPVSSSLRALREQSWVHLRAELERGTTWERYRVMESLLLGGHQQMRILDGVSFGPRNLGKDSAERSLVDGSTALVPNGDCVYLGEERLLNQLSARYSYTVNAGRVDAMVMLWISPSSNLPLKVRVEGPEMSFARALSRPGKPPQVSLRETGKTYIEWQYFEYGEVKVSQRARLTGRFL